MNIQEAYEALKLYSDEVFLTESRGHWQDDVDGRIDHASKRALVGDVSFHGNTWEEIIDNVRKYIDNIDNEEKLLKVMMAV